jgi:hypothetical protein
MNSNTNNVEYYKADPTVVVFWQGICPTNTPDEYLLVGTKQGGYGALYYGPIIENISSVNEVVFPQSTSTSVYGPEYLPDNTITLVGSYQTGEVSITAPCKGFGFKGSINDIDNPENYFEINADKDYKYTIVHSTRAGLAVYISSDISQLDFVVGKSFIYDIDKKETITEVHYPCSLVTTTYGIWYNGRKCGVDSYTISGGFSLDNVLTDTRIFVVDFLYNRCNGKMDFVNWTEIKTPGIPILAHAQGISGLSEDHYVLPTINFVIDPVDNTKLIKYGGERIVIERKHNKFVPVSFQSINYPESKLTIPTSAASNVIVGEGIDTNNSTFAFEAVVN